MIYRNIFEKALNETANCKLDAPSGCLPFHSEKIPKEVIFYSIEKFIPILKANNFLSSRELNGNCASVHLMFRDILKHIFSIESFITIGSMHINGFDYCSMSYNDIKRELKSPSADEKMAAHVWLTLPDGAIFDWTGLAWYYTYLGEEREIEDCILYIPPNEYSESHYYEPFLIGEEYLYKIGAI